MKFALRGILIGLTDTYIQGIKTKLKAIPEADYWKQDAYFTKDVNEENDSVLAFMVPFHTKATRNAFIKNWVRFYWGTEIVEDPETGETYETRVRKFEVKDAIKTLWQACKPGSRIWIELHDHDQSSRRGCKVEEIASK